MGNREINHVEAQTLLWAKGRKLNHRQVDTVTMSGRDTEGHWSR